MSATFTLQLQSATQYERIDGVRCFVGEDPSGRFALLARHEPLLTALVFGLCRYQVEDQPWMFVALPGGVLYMRDNSLMINTRHYVSHSDFELISEELSDRLLAEEQQLQSVKQSLKQMEEEMLRRLWDLRRQGEV